MTWLADCVCVCVFSHRRFVSDDLRDELRLLSLGGTESTVSNHSVLQQSLDYVWKGTFHKIPTHTLFTVTLYQLIV